LRGKSAEEKKDFTQEMKRGPLWGGRENRKRCQQKIKLEVLGPLQQSAIDQMGLNFQMDRGERLLIEREEKWQDKKI